MANTLDITQLQQIKRLDLIAKQIVEGFVTGLHKSPFHGFSVEFSEHRLYNSGESTKHIDWKLFARTEKMFVKRFEEETNLRCQFIIDISSSMFFPSEDYNKMLFSSYASAALMLLLQKQRDAFGLTLFSDKIDHHFPAKSTTKHYNTLLGAIENELKQGKSAQKGTSIVANLHTLAETLHKRSLVILFSDLFDRDNYEVILEAIQHLKHYKHEVIFFHTIDEAYEKYLAYDNRPYKFVDKETGEEVKLHPSMIQESYQQQVSAFQKELAYKCGQYGVDYIPVNIKDGFEKVCKEYLIKRQSMKG